MNKYNATLLVPAAGMSSRYGFISRPKWLLTHPDGNLMIEKVLDGIEYKKFFRVCVVILKDHCEKYGADIILHQIFGELVDVIILNKQTKSVIETISSAIKKGNINGQIVIKDSDCVVKSRFVENKNYIVGLNVNNDMDISNIHQKSFIVKNDDDIIVDIVEKKIVSNVVCVGVYSMQSDRFEFTYKKILESAIYKNYNELFVSHIVSYLMICEEEVFEYVEAIDYNDWGTEEEWLKEINKHSTYIFDIDGVFLKNYGKYGEKNWDNAFEPIDENIDLLKRLSDEGHDIIFMTSRTEEYVGKFKTLLNNKGVVYKNFICGCRHSKRIIVNDFAPTLPYPSCESISIKRNGLLKEYIR